MIARNTTAYVPLSYVIKNPKNIHTLSALICAKQQNQKTGILGNEYRRYVVAEAAIAGAVTKASVMTKIITGIKGLFAVKAAAVTVSVPVVAATTTTTTAAVVLPTTAIATKTIVLPVVVVGTTTATTTTTATGLVILGTTVPPVAIGAAVAGGVLASGYAVWSLCGYSKAAADTANTVASAANRVYSAAEILKDAGDYENFQRRVRNGASETEAYHYVLGLEEGKHAEYTEALRKLNQGVRRFDAPSEPRALYSAMEPVLQPTHTGHTNPISLSVDTGCNLPILEKPVEILPPSPIIEPSPVINIPFPIDTLPVNSSYHTPAIGAKIGELILEKGKNEILDKPRINNTPEDLAKGMREIKKNYVWDKQKEVWRLGENGKAIIDGVEYLREDRLHNEIELYDKRGRHLGALDPVKEEIKSNSHVPDRRLDI